MLLKRDRKYLKRFNDALLNYLKLKTLEYNLGTPNIKDWSYDFLENLCKSITNFLDEKFQLPWRDIDKGLLSHKIPMGTVKKIKNWKKIIEWGGSSWVEPKLDGLAISVEKDKLGNINVLTRGNGVFGDKINDKFFNLIKILQEQSWSGILRGELICPLNKYNRTKFSSPRNMVAGLINRKQRDSEIDSLKIIFFDIFDLKGNLPLDKINLIPRIKISNKREFLIAKMRVLNFSKKIPCDGLVVKRKLNDHSLNSSMERKEVACWKFSSMEVSTEIKLILWNIGKQGRYTPLGMIQPIKIGGSTIEKVSLHNLGFLKEKGLGEGAKINIISAGMTIPKVEKVIERSNKITFPKFCPHCLTELKISKRWLECPKNLCEGRLRELIVFLCSRNVLNIKHFSYSAINKICKIFKPLNVIRAISYPKIFKKMLLKSGLGKIISEKCEFSAQNARWKISNWLIISNRPLLGLNWTKKISETISLKEILGCGELFPSKGMPSAIITDFNNRKTWETWTTMVLIIFILVSKRRLNLN